MRYDEIGPGNPAGMLDKAPARLPVIIDDSSIKCRVVGVRGEVRTAGGGNTITIKTPFKAFLDYVKAGSWDVVKGWGKEKLLSLFNKWIMSTEGLRNILEEARSWAEGGELGISIASAKFTVFDIKIIATVEVTYRARFYDYETGKYGDWETRTFTVDIDLAYMDMQAGNINITTAAGANELAKAMQTILKQAMAKFNDLDSAAIAKFWAWLHKDHYRPLR